MPANADDVVLIIGAGPAGLTLAYGLSQRGIPFRVVDPLPEPVRDSRAHGFGGHTLLALDHLGLAEPMLAASVQPPPVLREYFGTKLVTEIDNGAAPRDPYPTVLPIFQQRVVRVLERALADRGHQVEWHTRFVDVEERDGGVRATVERDGEQQTIDAAWLVGCDGTRSTVRKQLRLETPYDVSDHHIMTCECDLSWKRSRDIWWTFHDREGIAGAIYNDFTDKWHVLIVEIGGARGKPDLAKMNERLCRRSGDPDVKMTNPAWVGAISLSQQIAPRFLEGHGILAGDAAHVFSSTAGHGLHAAIEDALNLEWKLALTTAGAAAPSLLSTYDLERRGHADEVVHLTRRALNFLTLGGWRGKLAWRLAFTVGRHSRSVGKIAERQTAKLESHYDTSPLTRQDAAQATPRTTAGRLVLDAPCRIGGRAGRLIEVFRGTEAHLVLFAGTAPTATTIRGLRSLADCVVPLAAHVRVHWVFPSEEFALDAGFAADDPHVVIDGLEKIRAAYGTAAPEVMFVRPDAVIGLRSQQLLARTLVDYLSRIYAVELLAPARARLDAAV